MKGSNSPVERVWTMFLGLKVEGASKAAALDVLQAYRARTRAGYGCLDCWVRQDVTHPDRIYFGSSWNSCENREAYMRSDPYRRVLMVLDMSDKPPVLRFDRIDLTRGTEYLGQIAGSTEGDDVEKTDN